VWETTRIEIHRARCRWRARALRVGTWLPPGSQSSSEKEKEKRILVVSRCRGIGSPSSGIVLKTLFLLAADLRRHPTSVNLQASWEYSSPLYCLIRSLVSLSSVRKYSNRNLTQIEGELTHHTLALSLYKILFHFKVLLWESTILLRSPPPTKPTLLHYYCATMVQFTPAYRPLLCMPYTIQY